MNKEEKKKNKQERLVQALRNNLKRRKQQTPVPSASKETSASKAIPTGHGEE